MDTKKKVLVVSEDPILLRFLKQLNGDEYEVTGDQHAAIILMRGLLKEGHADLIILDIMMPSLDGIKTCLEIRQFSNVPIVMLTAWGAGANEVKGINMASASFLTEPFGIDELKTRLKNISRHNLAAG